MTNGQMNLPVGKSVLVFLSSKDMVHSFALSQMRVQQDAIPEADYEAWLAEEASFRQ